MHVPAVCRTRFELEQDQRDRMQAYMMPFADSACISGIVCQRVGVAEFRGWEGQVVEDFLDLGQDGLLTRKCLQ